MPHRIAIEDLDIRAVEQALDEVSFEDEYRMAALRCCESQDIQACPGSGKTTLLVAKLAILARKWRWKDRGILVLSHTNVARQEVQKRLASLGGHKLLGYPHFVGTIQRFTNQFLALPFLRNAGISDYRIDNQLFGDRATSLLCNSWEFRKAYNFLENKPNIGARVVRGLRYEGGELSLGCASQDFPCGQDTDSGKQLKALKKKISTEDRIFRFDDMFSFAERYLREQSWVVPALQHRFPWVFVDEMQDTDDLQDHLLQVAFGAVSLIQRIGDTNQAIFGSTFAKESSSSFPLEGALQLPGSLRYCPAIAKIVRPLTRAHDPQELTGNTDVASRGHTIFTFTRETIGKVLPAFGKLLREEYGHDLPERFRAKAVGARRTGEASNERQFPFCISDYFGEFQSVAASTGTTFSSFIEFAVNGRAQFEKSGNFNDGWKIFIHGCLEVLRLQEVFDPSTCVDENSRSRRYSKTSLLERFSRAGLDRELRLHAFSLLNARVGLSDRSEWQRFSDELWRIVATCLDIESWNDDAKKFCAWVELGPTTEGAEGKRANTYIHKGTASEPDLEIEISTIHAAKGETHTATLVLDTFHKTHDLKSVLPFLLGSMKKITLSDGKRMKRTFVAMTRPRELLCLALLRDHIKDAQRNKLEKVWNFVDL